MELKAEWTSNKISLYTQLFYTKDKKQLTDEEEEFCKEMYHMEEYFSGLDGD